MYTEKQILAAAVYLKEVGYEVIRHKMHYHLFNEDGKPLSPNSISPDGIVAIAKFEKERRS